MVKIIKMKSKDIISNQIRKRWPVFGGLLLSIVITGIISGVAYTEAIRQITNSIWESKYLYLLQALLLFAVLIIANFTLTIVQRKLMFSLKKNLVYSMEDSVYQYYSGKEYWSKEGQEDALGYIRKIIPDAIELLGTQINNTCMIIVVGVSGCLYGASINPGILVISIVVTCILVLLSGKKNGKVPELYREVGERTSNMYNLLLEQVRNREIAGFLNQEKVVKGYEEKSKDYLKVMMRIKKATNGPVLFSQFGSMILIVLISWLGGTLVMNGGLRFADLLALIMLVQTIATRFFGIPEMMQGWKNVKGNWMNIDSLLQVDSNVKESGISLNEKISQITVNNLSFAYPGKEEKILKKVTLTLSEGTFYTMAGASGCGKSTLLRLITRLIPHWQGDIFINSNKLEDIQQEDYWQHLTYVEQVPVIVPGTLLYNITLDEKEYNLERLQRAVNDAALEGLVDKLADGFQTFISEKQLSKGEMQKVNIARALYRNSDVVLLDEVTEGLDPEAEIHILEALKRRSQEGVMVVCISHKIEALKASDMVVYMKDGHVEGVASHDILFNKNENYQRLIGENRE